MDEVFDLAELTLIVEGRAVELPVVGGAVSVSAVGERYDWSARVHLSEPPVPAITSRVQIEAVTEEGHILRGAADASGHEDLDKGTVLRLVGAGPLKIARYGSGR